MEEVVGGCSRRVLDSIVDSSCKILSGESLRYYVYVYTNNTDRGKYVVNLLKEKLKNHHIILAMPAPDDSLSININEGDSSYSIHLDQLIEYTRASSKRSSLVQQVS